MKRLLLPVLFVLAADAVEPQLFHLEGGIDVVASAETGLVFRSGGKELAFRPFKVTMPTNAVPPSFEFRAEGDALIVTVKGDETAFGTVEPGPCSQVLDRVFFGYGYCVEKPGAFQAGHGGHSCATGYAGFSFTNGFSLVMASTSPGKLFHSPKELAFGFRCTQPTVYTFVPGRKGAFDCAFRYREHVDAAPSPGFAHKAGRFCVDSWNGSFTDFERLITTAADQYGLTGDLLFYSHCWQRYGFDRHLPDVYPPSPTFGTADELKRACAAARTRGWSFGVHLNTIDCYPDSPWFSWDKICHFPNPKTGGLEPKKAWLNPPHNEQSYRLLPKYGPDSIRRQVASLLADDFRPDTVFIDVTGSNALLGETCWEKDGNVHSLNANSAANAQMFDAAREALRQAGAYVSSEAPCDYVAGHLDGGDCQWMCLQNENIPYRWLRIPAARIEKTPWFPIVHHHCMSLHGVGYSARYEGGRGEDCHGVDSDDYISCEIMNGHSLMADCYNRDAYKAEAGILEPIDQARCLRQIVRKYWLAQHILREIGPARVTSIAYEKDDPGRVIARWSTGMNVFVNRGRTDWPVRTGDEGLGTVVLPQYGFVSFNPATGRYAAIRRRGTHVVEESAYADGKKTVRYVNPRGEPSSVRRLPLVPRSTVAVTGDVWTVSTAWELLAGQSRPQGPFKVEFWLLDPMFREYSPKSAAVLAKTVEVASLADDTTASFAWPKEATGTRFLHVAVAPSGTPDVEPRPGAETRFKLLGTSAFYRLYRQGACKKGTYVPYDSPDANLWERLFPPSAPVDYGWIVTDEAFRLVSEPGRPDVKTPLPPVR